MKKIVIVSDNHGNKEILDRVYHNNLDADLYLHAGDSCMFDNNLVPFLSVKGNQDYYVANNHRLETIENVNIYMIHGHNILLSEDNILRISKEKNCQVFIHGHIHRPYFYKCEDIYIACPGALAYPRGVEGITYLIMYIDNGKITFELKKIK